MLDRLVELLRREQAAMAELLLALADFDQAPKEEVTRRLVLTSEPGAALDAITTPRATPTPAPVSTVEPLWVRDGGCCQWPVASGGVCGSTVRVELDHVLAKARGGPAVATSVRLLCRFHNDLAARQAFGDRWMDRFTRRGGERAEPQAGAT